MIKTIITNLRAHNVEIIIENEGTEDEVVTERIYEEISFLYKFLHFHEEGVVYDYNEVIMFRALDFYGHYDVFEIVNYEVVDGNVLFQ